MDTLRLVLVALLFSIASAYSAEFYDFDFRPSVTYSSGAPQSCHYTHAYLTNGSMIYSKSNGNEYITYSDSKCYDQTNFTAPPFYYRNLVWNTITKDHAGLVFSNIFSFSLVHQSCYKSFDQYYGTRYFKYSSTPGFVFYSDSDCNRDPSETYPNFFILNQAFASVYCDGEAAICQYTQNY